MLAGIPEESQMDVRDEIFEAQNLFPFGPTLESVDRNPSAPDEQEMARPLPIHQRINRLFFPNYEFTTAIFSSVISGLTVLIPLFYTGQIANESALAVASQFAFFSAILKVLQDTVITGMFYMIGRDYQDNRKTALHTLKICTFGIFGLGAIFSLIVMMTTNEIVNAIKTPESIKAATVKFLYFSSIGLPFILVTEAIKAHMIITRHVLIVLASVCQAVATLVANVLLFGTQSFSAHWGIEHLGYYKIIESVTGAIINSTFCFLIEEMSVDVFLNRVPFTVGMKQKMHTLIRVSWANFCESAVRNLFYFVVILIFVNQLGAEMSAAWYVVNTILWSFLLIPSFTVAGHVKVAIARQAFNPHLKEIVRKVMAQSGCTLSAWCLLVGAISVGTWPWIVQIFSPNNSLVQNLAQSIFFHIGWVFIVFAFSNAASGIFYGLGETRYVLYVCCISNALVYFVPWIMYLGNWIEPTYWWVLGLYTLGIILSAAVTAMCALVLYKRIGLQHIIFNINVNDSD